jgi:hypothetical protein
MSSSDDVDRVLAVVSDLKHTAKRLEILHETRCEDGDRILREIAAVSATPRAAVERHN